MCVINSSGATGVLWATFFKASKSHRSCILPCTIVNNSFVTACSDSKMTTGQWKGKQEPYWPPYFHNQFVVTVDQSGCLLFFYSAANYKAPISLHVAEPETWQEFVCFLLGNSPASEFYMPTFQNTLSVPSSWVDRYLSAYEDGTDRVFRNVSI